LGGIDGDKKRLYATLFCELYKALRHSAILVDISSKSYIEIAKHQKVIGYVQLEELHLTWLSGIDQFVKGTRRQSGYLGQLYQLES
jgi:hypothetical protein